MKSKGKGLSGRQFKDLVYQNLARFANALSAPMRLEILDLLCQSERTGEELAGLTGGSVANVSHHLQTLKGAGLVESRRAGKYIYYRASRSGLQCWASLAKTGEESLPEIRLAVQEFFSGIESLDSMSIAELKKKSRKGEVVVLDVRPREEFETWHLPGAMNLPLEELDAKLAELPAGKEILAYCRGPYCVLSRKAVEKLQSQGYRAGRLTIDLAALRASDQSA